MVPRAIEARRTSFLIWSPPKTAGSALLGNKSTRLTHSGRGGENSPPLSAALPPRRLTWERLSAVPCSHLSKQDTWMESWKCNLHSKTPEAISRHDLSRPAATSLLPFNSALMGSFVQVASDSMQRSACHEMILRGRGAQGDLMAVANHRFAFLTYLLLKSSMWFFGGGSLCAAVCISNLDTD